MEGCSKGGMQEMRNLVNEGFRKGRCRKGGCRTGGMSERRDAGKE